MQGTENGINVKILQNWISRIAERLVVIQPLLFLPAIKITRWCLIRVPSLSVTLFPPIPRKHPHLIGTGTEDSNFVGLNEGDGFASVTMNGENWALSGDIDIIGSGDSLLIDKGALTRRAKYPTPVIRGWPKTPRCNWAMAKNCDAQRWDHQQRYRHFQSG